MPSLAEIMIEKDFNVYGASDCDWVRFVVDHRKNIIETSITHVIDNDNKNRFKYSLFEFLQEINVDVRFMWIIQWLNDLPSQKDFNNVSSLIIPSYTYIESLYRSYRSYKAKLKQESK